MTIAGPLVKFYVCNKIGFKIKTGVLGTNPEYTGFVLPLFYFDVLGADIPLCPSHINPVPPSVDIDDIKQIPLVDLP